MIVKSILDLLIEVLVLGFIAWLIDLAPFINPTFKTFINYVLIVLAAILVIGFLIEIVNGNPILLTN